MPSTDCPNCLSPIRFSNEQLGTVVVCSCGQRIHLLRACDQIAGMNERAGVALVAGVSGGFRAKARVRLWAVANHKATALTFCTPRTNKRIKLRFRACALT